MTVLPHDRFFPRGDTPLHIEEHLHIPLLLRTQEIRNVSKQICEEAAVAREQAREMIQICLLRKQRRIAEHEVTSCGETLTGSFTAV